MTATVTYCSECGQPLATPSAKFCSACGTPVAGPAPIAPALAPISPRVQPTGPTAAPASRAARTPEPPRRGGRIVVLVIVILVGLVAAFMLGARTNSDSAATDLSPAQPSSAGIPDPGTGQPTSPANDEPPAIVTPSDPATPVMPSVVGMVLQDAQDVLQSQGSYLMDQADASGEGRLQFFDSNWRVCSQQPSAGSPLSSMDIVTLSSVKLDESCP